MDGTDSRLKLDGRAVPLSLLRSLARPEDAKRLSTEVLKKLADGDVDANTELVRELVLALVSMEALIEEGYYALAREQSVLTGRYCDEITFRDYWDKVHEYDELYAEADELASEFNHLNVCYDQAMKDLRRYEKAEEEGRLFISPKGAAHYSKKGISVIGCRR